jgi:hypothetical protein
MRYYKLFILCFINFFIQITALTENEIRDALIATAQRLSIRVPGNIEEIVNNIKSLNHEAQLLQMRQVIDSWRRFGEEQGLYGALKPTEGVLYRERDLAFNVSKIIQECLGEPKATSSSQDEDIENYFNLYPEFIKIVVRKLQTSFPDIADKSEKNLNTIANSILNGIDVKYFNQALMDSFLRDPRNFIDNLPKLKNGIDDRGQVYNLMLFEDARPIESFVSSYGQYAAGAKSACTAICYRVAERIICGLERSGNCLQELIDSGKKLYDQYRARKDVTTPEHISVHDILALSDMPREIKKIGEVSLTVDPQLVTSGIAGGMLYDRLPQLLIEKSNEVQKSVCAVVTKQPETFLVCYDFNTREFILFDSHRQYAGGPAGSGLHFFKDSRKLSEYLKVSNPEVKNLPLDQSFHLNNVEVTLFAKSSEVGSSS